MHTQVPESKVFYGDIGRGWIRTNEGISHQIYSLTRLATSVHARQTAFSSLGGGVYERHS